MCDHGCSKGVDCTHVREGDVWIVSSGPASTETARPATETRQEPEPVHAPALTRDGFTGALTALRRDGGADPYTRGGRRGW